MSIVVVLTYGQLKALKSVYNNAERVDWAAYEEAKDVILSTPLDVPEDLEMTIGQIHAGEA